MELPVEVAYMHCLISLRLTMRRKRRAKLHQEDPSLIRPLITASSAGTKTRLSLMLLLASAFQDLSQSVIRIVCEESVIRIVCEEKQRSCFIIKSLLKMHFFSIGNLSKGNEED